MGSFYCLIYLILKSSLKLILICSHYSLMSLIIDLGHRQGQDLRIFLAGKQEMTPGQAHAQLSAKEIGGQQAHQDNCCSDMEDAVVCFLQGGGKKDHARPPHKV